MFYPAGLYTGFDRQLPLVVPDGDLFFMVALDSPTSGVEIGGLVGTGGDSPDVELFPSANITIQDDGRQLELYWEVCSSLLLLSLYCQFC